MSPEDKLELETEDEHRARQLQVASTPARSAERVAATAAAGPSRRLLLLLLVATLGIGAWEAGAALYQHRSAPEAKDWRAAAAKLRAERRAGEPVLFAPLWVEPVGHLHFGDQLGLELLLLSDVDRYGRVFEASVRGARHPWLAGLTPARSWRFGGVTLSLFQKPAEEVLFDFTRRIREAEVERVGDRVTRCNWEDRRFACDRDQRWNWVGPHLAEVEHRPYRCIYAHAVDGNVMRISFASVPIGSRIVGYTGIDDFENRKRSQKPVLLRVRVGDEEVGAVTHQNAWPWRRFSFETKAQAGRRARVRFEISTPGAFARTFCFAAEARR